MVHWWVLVHCGYKIGLEAWFRSGSGYSKRPSLFPGSDLILEVGSGSDQLFSKEGRNMCILLH